MKQVGVMAMLIIYSGDPLNLSQLISYHGEYSL
jgi:hypothetical protein